MLYIFICPRAAACKPAVNVLKRLPSIIVIRIDHAEWFIDSTSAREDRLSCPPWFPAACRYFISVRKVILLLKNVCHISIGCDPVADHFSEIFLQISSYHKNDPVESRFQRVIDGIIHDDLSGRPERGQLFDPLSKTASNAGRHDHKTCMHIRTHRYPSCLSTTVMHTVYYIPAIKKRRSTCRPH